MPSKEQVLATVKNEAHSGAMVKHLINSITSIETKRPVKLRKGDVIVKECFTTTKKRPYVLIKVLKEFSLALPLSTTEDSLNLCESDSRFFRVGFFSNQLVTLKNQDALENFAGIYDNPRNLNKAVKIMKEFLDKNLR